MRRSTTLPARLPGAVSEEPLYLDPRWVKTETDVRACPGQEPVSRLFPSPHAGPGPEKFECIQFRTRRLFGPSEQLEGRAKRVFW